MRLSDAGPAALARLRVGTASEEERRLGRRLVDAGLAAVAAPPPATATPEVTVVVPVRDRPAELARLLVVLARRSRKGAPNILVVDDGSTDPRPVVEACAAYGARLLRRPHPGGPAAARNAALEHVDTELVALLDSDCLPPPGWIERLSAHLADPLVAAVAPRIDEGRKRSPLDMGPTPGDVGPGRAITYVPTVALLARTAALADRPFDEGLRYGEDVDLVWRLTDAGHRVRYDPSVIVAHQEPPTRRARFERRRRYGTSAGPLARRHPGRLAPAVLRPVPTAAVVLAARGHATTAVATALSPAVPLARTLHRLGAPPTLAPRLAATAALDTVAGLSHAATVLAAPALLAALTHRRTRTPAVALLVAGAAKGARPDDLAYGLGVWQGAIGARTIAPLLPALRHSEPGL